MKKLFLLTIVVIFSVSSLYAQEPNMSVYGRKHSVNSAKIAKFFKSLHYSDELMVGVGLDPRSHFSFGDLAVAYHRFGDTLSLGVGLGLQGSMLLDNMHYFYQSDEVSCNYSMALLMPIFVRAKVSPFRFGQWVPFMRLDVGGVLHFGNAFGGGFAFAPALGTNMMVNNKLNLFFALSCQWMQTSYEFDGYLGQTASIQGSSATSLMLHAGIDF